MHYAFRSRTGDVTRHRFKLKHILMLAGAPLESWREEELEADAKDVTHNHALELVNSWNARAMEGAFFVELPNG